MSSLPEAQQPELTGHSIPQACALLPAQAHATPVKAPAYPMPRLMGLFLVLCVEELGLEYIPLAAYPSQGQGAPDPQALKCTRPFHARPLLAARFQSQSTFHGASSRTGTWST